MHTHTHLGAHTHLPPPISPNPLFAPPLPATRKNLKSHSLSVRTQAPSYTCTGTHLHTHMHLHTHLHPMLTRTRTRTATHAPTHPHTPTPTHAHARTRTRTYTPYSHQPPHFLPSPSIERMPPRPNRSPFPHIIPIFLPFLIKCFFFLV